MVAPHTEEPRPPCSRFQAHMRACPGLIRPPYIPNTHHLQRSSHLFQKRKSISAPKPPSRKATQRHLTCLNNYNRGPFSVVFPSVPVSPNPSLTSSDPLICPALSGHSETNSAELLAFPYISSNETTSVKQEAEHGQVPLTGRSFPQFIHEVYEEIKDKAFSPMTMTPSSLLTPETPLTPRTPDSLTDLSFSVSSQSSHRSKSNTRLSSAYSVNQNDDSDVDAGDDDNDNDDDNDDDDTNADLEACSSSLYNLCFSPSDSSALASCSPPTSPQCCLSTELNFYSQESSITHLPKNTSITSAIYIQESPQRQTPDPNQLNVIVVDGVPGPCHVSPGSQSRQAHPYLEENFSDWKASPWPVLPPIMPQKDKQETGATLSSPTSCDQSDIFAELDAAAPQSTSCVSLDNCDLSDKDLTSPTTDLSPGLAAITAGCDSGDLGSLSRVQFLLLDRQLSKELEPLSEPEWNSSIGERDYEPGLQVWSLGIPQHYQSSDAYTPVSCNSRSVSSSHIGQIDSQSGSPALTYDEVISKSSSPWSLKSDLEDGSCGSGENTGYQEQLEGNHVICDAALHLSSQLIEEDPVLLVMDGTSQNLACPGQRDQLRTGGRRGPNQIRERRRHQRKMLGGKGEAQKNKALQIYSKLWEANKPSEPSKSDRCSRFEDFDFLAKYCIFSPEKFTAYKHAFEAVDTDGDGYLSCFQVLLALKEIIPPEMLTEEEEIYVYRILELVDYRVTEGLTDLRLFAVVASLAQKIATLDNFMRSLICKMDFKSLERKLYKAKQLFLFLLEGQTGGTVAQQGCISAEQLLVELKAGGIREEHEDKVRQELRGLRSLDLLDFLAYLPLFILIHNSVIANPLDDTSNL